MTQDSQKTVRLETDSRFDIIIDMLEVMTSRIDECHRGIDELKCQVRRNNIDLYEHGGKLEGLIASVQSLSDWLHFIPFEEK